MIINPIIPIWLMAIICIALFVVRIKEKWGRIRQFVIVALIFAINLRPMVPNGTVQTTESNLDVILVVDNTLSMYANDYVDGQTRKQGVIKDCDYITDQMTGARFSVICFNNTSQILVPFTTDVDMVNTAVETMPVVDPWYATGSSLDVPKNDLLKQLKRSRESEGDRKTIVLFMSDGEITSEEKLASYAELKQYIDLGIVIGYGTEDGGTMAIEDIYTGKVSNVVDNSTGKDAVSVMDESNLKQIAKDLGIDYVYQDGKTDLSGIVNDAKDVMDFVSVEEKEGSKDLYYIFAIPLVLMFLLEWFLFERNKK